MHLTRLLYRLVVWSLVMKLFTCVAVVRYAYPAGESASSEIAIEDSGEEGYRRALDLIKQGKNSEALPLLEAAWRQPSR